MLITPISICNPTSSQAPDISNQMAHRPLTLTCLPQLLPTSANGSTTHQLLTTPRKPLSSAAHINPPPPQHHQLSSGLRSLLPPLPTSHLPSNPQTPRITSESANLTTSFPCLKPANGFPLHLEIKFKLFISSEGALQDLALPAAPKSPEGSHHRGLLSVPGRHSTQCCKVLAPAAPSARSSHNGLLNPDLSSNVSPSWEPVTDQPHYSHDPAPSQLHHLKQARLQAALLPELI